MTIFFYGTERNTYNQNDFLDNLDEIATTGTNTIVLIPYAFQENRTSTHINRDDPRSILDSDFVEACSITVAQGFYLIIKPQVNVTSGIPRAEIEPSDLNAWKNSYLNFILHYAAVAESVKATFFCVGTEFMSLSENTELWNEIIDSCANHFHGNLIYSTAPQEALSIRFWNKLDYIGVNAYFPASKRESPELEDILFAWSTWKSMMKDISLKYKKNVLLTEIGYMNHSLAAQNPGDYKTKGQRNDQLQADCYEAALIASEEMSFLKGMFWWQWELNDIGGDDNIDYTPRGKLAEKVLTRYWK